MPNATILEQRELTSRLHLLTLAVAEFTQVQPTQFVMINSALGNRTDPALRLCAWIVASDKQTISVMIDRSLQGGDLIASLPQGMKLDLLGLCGRPLTLPPTTQTTLLIAEGLAVSSLVLYAQRASRHNHPTLLLASGDDSQRIPAWLLPPDIEYLTTSGDVLELLDNSNKLENPLNWANRLVAAGSQDFGSRLAEKIRRERFRWQNGFASMIIYQDFTCGIGLCGACWTPTRQGEKLACAQGPAFELRELLT